MTHSRRFATGNSGSTCRLSSTGREFQDWDGPSILKVVILTIFVMGCIVVLGTMGLSALIGSAGGRPAAANNASTYGQPFSVIGSDGQKYMGGIVGNVGIAVLGVQPSAAISSVAAQQPAQDRFILVTVAIQNRQNTAITMDSSLFTIISDGGNVYHASSKSMDVDSRYNLFFAGINPGVTRLGTVIFDVPQNLDLNRLMLRVRAGMTGNSVNLPLRVLPAST